MHEFPEKQQWIYNGLTHNSMNLDVGFETLNLKLCEFNLRELTVEVSHAEEAQRHAGTRKLSGPGSLFYCFLL